MRILVVSDTHGDFANLYSVVMSQPKAEVVFHLGDGEDEARKLKMLFTDKMIISVRGNCDWGSSLPTEETITIEGKKILAAHGHTYNVKMGCSEIYYNARSVQVDILLFGHTHQPKTDYSDGLYIMNPGSLHGTYGSYGIIDITPQGVVTSIINLNK